MFYDPLERLLRDSGANVSFIPMDFRRNVPAYAVAKPRVMCTAAAPPDGSGMCSLSLHAGATVEGLHQAGADLDRLLVAEVSDRFPRTRGLPPEHSHALHLDEIDVLIETDREPPARDNPVPSDRDRAIAEHARAFVPEGATLQTGVGAIPSVVAALLAEGDGGDYGIHSELFTPGLMRLHQAGKVTNRKGQYDGVSVATFAAGNRELYDWLDGNEDVAFLPVDAVNSPGVIRRNRRSITINGAISVDIHGQVVADTINGNQYSGIGGHEDFVAGPGLSLEARSLLCLPSTITLGDQLHSRIVPWFDAGTVITTPDTRSTSSSRSTALPRCRGSPSVSVVRRSQRSLTPPSAKGCGLLPSGPAVAAPRWSSSSPSVRAKAPTLGHTDRSDDALGSDLG
jgi:acyl-CoA hydrolase